MKQFFLFAFLTIIGANTNAQVNSINEQFNSAVTTQSGQSNNLNAWYLSQGISSTPDSYNNPTQNCVSDKGLQTAGVSGSSPGRIITPAILYNSNSTQIEFSFDFFIFASSNSSATACRVVTPTCPIYMNIYIVPSSYISTNADPTGNNIISYQRYQINNVAGNNSTIFTLPSTFNSNYRFFLTFTSSCGQSGVKYMIDNIKVTPETPCLSCPPEANDDYFEFGQTGWSNLNSLKGNVYGGFAVWSSDNSVSGYNVQSLQTGTATGHGGKDEDVYLTKLEPAQDPGIVFLSSGILELVNGSCGQTTPHLGDLTFNSNGTFTYNGATASLCVNEVKFKYRIRNNSTSFESNEATVTIKLRAPAALPVSFKSFSATRNKERVNLKWETVSEQSNKGFYVQRNTNGTWNNVAFVFSQAQDGNSSSLLNYEFKDLNNERGVSQYRLQQVDIDLRFRYSEIRMVRGEEQPAKHLLFPNPSNDGKINIVFDVKSATRNILVSDMSGRVVKSFRNITAANLSIDNLENGVYSIQIIDLSTAVSSVEKVIIKRR